MTQPTTSDPAAVASPVPTWRRPLNGLISASIVLFTERTATAMSGDPTLGLMAAVLSGAACTTLGDVARKNKASSGNPVADSILGFLSHIG